MMIRRSGYNYEAVLPARKKDKCDCSKTNSKACGKKIIDACFEETSSKVKVNKKWEAKCTFR
jgi:hypothetical protein